MIIGVVAILISLLYSIMVAIIYYSKKHIDNFENKIYGILVKINILGLLLELGCCYFTYNMGLNPMFSYIGVWVNKLFTIYLLTWEFIFTGYVVFISFSDKKKFNDFIKNNKKKISLFVIGFYAICLLLVVFLPLYFFNDGTYVYSYGPSTDLLMALGALFVGVDIFCVIKNLKNIRNKKYYPLFALVSLMVVVLIIRNTNPGIILLNSLFAFVTIFMFHTIENPDVLLIEELYKNKTLVDEATEEKTNFLFKLTQDLRSYVKEINNLSYELTQEEDKSKLKEGIKIINQRTREFDFVVNDVLDISSIDAKNIKITASRYNPKIMFDKIALKAKKDLKEKVEFRYEVPDVLPKYLNGDSIKLQQVINTLIENSKKYTNEGFIELDIDVIEKYDVCRLYIEINDTGCGMSIDKVNDILKTDKELTEEDLKSLDKMHLNLSLCKKIMNLIGGSIMVRSEKGKGTRVSIIVDQIIVKEKKKSTYQKVSINTKKILLIDDDAEELKYIKDKINKYDVNVNSSMYGKDCIEKIESGYLYDLIIIDDDLIDGSAMDVLNQLKEKNKKTMPVIVMLSDKKLSIKDHYLEDGFDDYIAKEKINSELERIMEKY